MLESDLESIGAQRQILHQMDYVFHLAADKDFFGGKRVFRNNVRQTAVLLDALKGSTQLKRLVFASTMGAVDRPPSDPCRRPLTESAPEHPTSPYGKAKLESEKRVRDSSLPFAIVRFPWCYGPGMSPGTHVRKLTEMVMRGKWGTRFNWPGRVSLLEVSECSRVLEFAASSQNSLCETLFVCDGAPIPLGSLLREAGRLAGRPAGDWRVPETVRKAVFLMRPILPLASKALVLDVLCVDDEKIRGLGFRAAERKSQYLLPLLRDLNDRRFPSRHRSRALVTGSGSGIGYALCLQIAARGRNQILVDKDASLGQLVGEIPGATAVVSDLADRTQLASLAEFLEDPSVNWVINCAGVGLRTSPQRRRKDETLNVLDVNISALTWLSELALEIHRGNGGGVLVNMASSAAFHPLPGMAAYAASKAFVLHYSEALAEEFRNTPLQILTVCPGGVSTRFQETAGVAKVGEELLLEADYVSARILRGIEQGRSGVLMIGGRPRAMALLSRCLPRTASRRLWGILMQRMR